MNHQVRAALPDHSELVRDFMLALPDDLPGAVERYGADNITWALPPTVPGGARPWVGKAAVMKFLRMMELGFAPGSMRIVIHEIIGSGDRFAVRHRISAQSTGFVDYENEYVFFISLENGKIVDVLEFVDTAKVLSIFG